MMTATLKMEHQLFNMGERINLLFQILFNFNNFYCKIALDVGIPDPFKSSTS